MKKVLAGTRYKHLEGKRWIGKLGKTLNGVCIFLLGGVLLAATPFTSRAESSGVESIYDDGIPINIRIYCEVIGNQRDICPEILEAIARHESRFTVDATNGKHYGLMQVNVKVHKERLEKFGYTEADMLTNAYANIEVAADYLRELYDTYGDENPIVLAVYAGNWKAVSNYKEYGWICPYAQDILKHSAEYERIHGK